MPRSLIPASQRASVLSVPLDDGKTAKIIVDPTTGTLYVEGASVVVHRNPFRVVDEKVTQIEPNNVIATVSQCDPSGAEMTTSVLCAQSIIDEESEAPFIGIRVQPEDEKEGHLPPGIYIMIQSPDEEEPEIKRLYSLELPDDEDLEE